MKEGKLSMYCSECGIKVSDNALFCPSCGKALNEKKNHNSTKAIQFRCRDCNCVMVIEKENRMLKCPACGSTELIVESDAVTIERIKSNTQLELQKTKKDLVLEIQKSNTDLEMEKLYYQEKKKDRQNKKDFKALVLYFAIIAVVFAFSVISNNIRTNKEIAQGKISIPYSAEKCIGENYKTIYTLFQDAGFSNIELKPLDDLQKSDSENDGLVYRIMINGDVSFSSSKRYLPNDKINIYYHSFQEQ